MIEMFLSWWPEAYIFDCIDEMKFNTVNEDVTMSFILVF